MASRVTSELYGRPVAEKLRACLMAAKADDMLAPVTVVVPSNQVGVATRRLLASADLGPAPRGAGGLVAVSFVTVYRMAELLGAASLAAQGRRPVSTAVIASALRSALRARPGIFAPVAEQAATQDALVSAYKMLRDIPEESLDLLAAQSPRAGDVVALQRAARSILQPEFSDEEDLMGAAIEAVRSGKSSLDALGSVIVYLPQRLSRHGAAFLRAVAERRELLVVAGMTGNALADAEVARSLRRLHDSHEPGERPGTGEGPGPPSELPGSGPIARPPGVPTGTRVLTASDADEEARSAVRAVVDAARRGVPLERIAVLYGSREPYARLVHEQLTAAGIPLNGEPIVPLSARATGRILLGLLDLPATGFRRSNFFAWLAGARLRHRGHPAPATAWERISREAGVVIGREQWDTRLATFAGESQAEAARAEADTDAPEWLAARNRENAKRALELRQFALELIDDLTEASASPKSWSQHAAWAMARVTDLAGPDQYRSSWPHIEQKAAERIGRATARLAVLDAVEGPVTLEVFRRALELELERDPGRTGRMGEGVLVGPVSMGLGLDLDQLVVLGLAEGSFPAPPAYDSLLPDAERAVLGGELPLCTDSTERQHRELLAALAGARDRLLCVPRGDLRQSNLRFPSRWVSEIVGDGSTQRTGLHTPTTAGPLAEEVASYEAGLRHTSFPATPQEYRLRALLAVGPARGGVLSAGATLDNGTLGDGALGDGALSAGWRMLAARRSSTFTRFDGNLAGLSVASPATMVTSATRLEGWARCPFAYFLSEVLRVNVVEDPEDRLQISPLDLGSLIHEVLEEFLREVMDGPAEQRSGPSPLWSGTDVERLMQIARTRCDHYEIHGLVGRPVFWARDRRRILADFQRFLDLDQRLRASTGAWPIAAELPFGLPGSRLGPVQLPLPDGRFAAFRGKADRLDLGLDGVLGVIDYKTGRSTDYQGLSAANPDDRGKRLQLVVYGLAARAQQGRPDAVVRSEYWFITSKGGFKTIGYDVTAEVLERVGRTVGSMVEGIEAGVFPNYPTATSTSAFVECQYCDPDNLGVVDLRHQLGRKRSDPSLAIFLDLAEGPQSGDGTDPPHGQAEADDA